MKTFSLFHRLVLFYGTFLLALAPSTQSFADKTDVNCIKTLSIVSENTYPTLPLKRMWSLKFLLELEDNGFETQNGVEPSYKRTYESFIRKIMRMFASDPMLAGLSEGQYRKAAKRALEWEAQDRDKYEIPETGLEIERYRLFLIKKGFDPEYRPRRWAPLFRNFGYDYFTHITTTRSLFRILSELEMKPLNQLKGFKGEGENQANDKYVYVSVPRRNLKAARPTLLTDRPLSNDLIDNFTGSKTLILISVDAIDKFKWSRGNTACVWGSCSPRTRLDHSLAALGYLNFVSQYTGELNQYRDTPRILEPEWLFTEPIHLDKVDFRVLITPKKKKAFINRAKKAGIPEWVIQKIE